MKDYPSLLLEENKLLLDKNAQLREALGSVISMIETYRDYLKSLGDKLHNPKEPPILTNAKRLL